MHAAEHRALRELFAFTTQLERHWSVLGARLGEGGAALGAGAAAARELLEELQSLTDARGLPIEHMARFAGRFASARPGMPDRLLERNQALRFAALDAQHVVTLLAYITNLALADGDEQLRGFCARWERKLRSHERAVRLAAIALGERPDEAILPADGTTAGEAGARVGAAIGALGEWVDRQAVRRRG